MVGCPLNVPSHSLYISFSLFLPLSLPLSLFLSLFLSLLSSLSLPVSLFLPFSHSLSLSLPPSLPPPVTWLRLRLLPSMRLLTLQDRMMRTATQPSLPWEYSLPYSPLSKPCCNEVEVFVCVCVCVCMCMCVAEHHK